MTAVEIVQDKTTKASYPASAKVGARLHKEMLHHGLYTRARGDVVCLAPPLVTSAEQVDRIVEILRQAIPAVVQG
jgi:putrescine---pyruvate transaminase